MNEQSVTNFSNLLNLSINQKKNEKICKLLKVGK